MYSHFKSMLEVCQQHDWPLWKAICAEETELTGKSEENTFERMELRYQIMRRSAEIALENPLPGHTGAPTLITGSAHTHNSYAASGCTLCGPILNKVMARALSCSEANASMGRVCAMPTAGSCGIVPAVMVTLEEELQLPRRKVLEALIIASGVGSVITQNATVSGAEGGCQAECGAAAAMAAAAAVYLKGGTPDQSMLWPICWVWSATPSPVWFRSPALSATPLRPLTPLYRPIWLWQVCRFSSRTTRFWRPCTEQARASPLPSGRPLWAVSPVPGPVRRLPAGSMIPETF